MQLITVKVYLAGKCVEVRQFSAYISAHRYAAEVERGGRGTAVIC